MSGFNISSTQVELAVVQFSDDAETVIGLSADANAIHSAVNSLVQDKENTDTEKGFRQCKSVLDSQGRSGTAGKLVILLTDGHQNKGLPAKITADALKAENATIFGIGVGKDVSEAYIDQWISPPTSTHYFGVADFASLDKKIHDILKAACPHPI